MSNYSRDAPKKKTLTFIISLLQAKVKAAVRNNLNMMNDTPWEQL